MFLLKKRFWLFVLKVLCLVFVAGMLAVQIPNLRYALGPKTPAPVETPEGLSRDRFGAAAFVSIQGRPDFDQAFVYKRYGLSYTYFTVQPYGLRLVVRTHETVTDDWRGINRFLGKLRRFERQPFSYRIRQIYHDRFGVDIPDDGFFLSLDEVPRLSGWQAGATIFALVLWLVLFYFFFLFRGFKK